MRTRPARWARSAGVHAGGADGEAVGGTWGSGGGTGTRAWSAEENRPRPPLAVAAALVATTAANTRRIATAGRFRGPLREREGVGMDDDVAVGVAGRFGAGGPVTQVVRHGGGHIHDTWFVSAERRDLVLQRLNDRVFPDCVQMMGNVLRVSSHVGRKDRIGTPNVLHTRDGAILAYDRDGHPWRAFERRPHATSRPLPATPEEAQEVGRALGRFFADVQDLPGPPLEEPIPGFKDFRRRKADFEFLVDLDPFRRAGSCRAEIEAVRHYHRLVKRLVEAEDRGLLPLRILHNDAKSDNVLLDDETGRAVAVVDLDTVAPGSVLFDIGDLLRSATVTAQEDAEDVSDLAVRDRFLEAALRGWLSEARGLLYDSELELIPMAGPLMAYESAMRFLTDHLAGDTYFAIDRPRQNLDRARAQLRVLEALDRCTDRVAELVATACAN